MQQCVYFSLWKKRVPVLWQVSRMTKKDHRFWNIAGVIIIILFVALEAFSIGRMFGGRSRESEQLAVESLEHALEVIDTVDVEDLESVCESFDTVMDDIHDALAWMGKTG